MFDCRLQPQIKLLSYHGNEKVGIRAIIRTSRISSSLKLYFAGQPVINPSRRLKSKSLVNLVIAGTEAGKCTMLEGDAKNVNHKIFLECIQTGLEQCAVIAGEINNLAN